MAGKTFRELTANSAPAGTRLVATQDPVSGEPTKSTIAQMLAAGATRVSPSAFGGVGDGVTDDTAALTAALAASSQITLDGKVWRVTSRVAVAGAISISGPGEIFVDGDCEGAGVDMHGSWTVFDVAGAPENVDYVLGLSATSQITRVPMGASELSAIDVPCTVKIFSDDQSSGVETGKYRGEFARAQAKDSSYLYLTGRLRETYTTNRNLAVFDEHAVSLLNFTVRGNYEAGVTGDWDYALLRLVGHVSPHIDGLTVRDGNGRGLELKSCIGANIANVVAKRFRNAISTDQIPGYGIQDGGGQNNGYVNITAEDCRHGWTTVHYTPVAGDPTTYGRSRGHTVTNGRALGCSAAAFDFHSDQEGCSFINCTSYHPYAGDTEAGVGFQVRGTEATLSQCRAFGGRHGFSITQGWNGEGGRHRIRQAYVEGAIRSVRIFRSSTSDTGIVKASIEQSVFVQSGTTEVFQASDANLTVKDVEIYHNDAPSIPRWLTIDDSDGVTVRAERVHYTVDAENGCLVRYAGANNDVSIFDSEVVADDWDCVIRTSGEGSPFDDVVARFAVYSSTVPDQVSGHINLGVGSDVEGLVTTERLTFYGWSP